MNAAQVTEAFNHCFTGSHNVLLCGGASEPLYEPAGSKDAARIWFREDYASSALHEAAHWLIAGPERRSQIDYGYWYEGERNADTQRRFEAAEARPQGLEWILSESAGIEFRVSCDNFDDSTLNLDQFRQSVQREVRRWLQRGLPTRAGKFQQTLSQCSGRLHSLACETYQMLPR